MTRIRKFLTELDDYELAFFAKFKLATFLEKAQWEIKNYIADKGLTEKRIEKLIATNPKRETKDGEIRCPRCSSNKISREKNKRTEARVGIADENNSLEETSNIITYEPQAICNVCGLLFKEPYFERKRKPFWHYIADGIFDIFVR